MKIGFKNHPSTSSEYVRFLIQNASVGRVIRLENQYGQVKERLQSIDDLAKAAMRKGETALNRAEEAKRLSKK